MFCHATEDEEKVLQAVRNVLPESLREKKPETEKLFGLYKNKITKFSIRLGRRESREFIEFLKTNLPEDDRKQLVREAPERIDGSGFFFRLDKQEAYNHGRPKVAEGDDTIEVRLTIETFGKGILEEEVTKLFLGCSREDFLKLAPEVVKAVQESRKRMKKDFVSHEEMRKEFGK